MAISKQLTIVVSGVTSIILLQSLSSLGAPLDHSIKRLSVSLSFGAPALAGTPAKASSKFRYVPPKRGRPKNTQAAGSRGCGASSQSQPILTLLVPRDHDGLTVSGHPTFFWHVSAPVPMAFALTEQGMAQPLLEQQIQPREAGIVQLAMPKDLPELVQGRKYRWSVTLTCNPDRPSANPFVQSWLERVPISSKLALQLATTASEREHALTYAQGGLWYDALEAISTAYSVNFKDHSILEERLSLLEQAGLTEVATQERQHLARQFAGQARP